MNIRTEAFQTSRASFARIPRDLLQASWRYSLINMPNNESAEGLIRRDHWCKVPHGHPPVGKQPSNRFTEPFRDGSVVAIAIQPKLAMQRFP
ncbi:hypothetical protein [Ralstonia flatus]|uniref:hypothetical protein n=1 Tax=Ralstonia flatus TaxID=3058601 RepID=UPI00197F2EE8|nr:hypothetical protein [Ralstonia sp. LMG 32965]MBN6208955.1 hypothetical protein [Ralstonia pickettii]